MSTIRHAVAPQQQLLRGAPRASVRPSAPLVLRTPSAYGSASQSRPRTLQTPAAVGNTSSAVYEAAAPPGDDPVALRKMLREQGWSNNWIEGIFTEAKRRSFLVSLQGAGAVLEALEGEAGLDRRQIENMCSKVPGILGRELADIQAVLGYVKARGATPEEARSILLKNPRMLVFDVTADGKQLAAGKARMELDVTTDGAGKRYPIVSVFRDDAAFETAPVSPWRPREQLAL